MTATRSMNLCRRALIGLLFAAVPSAMAFGRDAAKLSTRDVVRLLVEARGDARPDLSHADLGGLDLADLDFNGADLSHCNLFGADLTGSNLEGANLAHAKLDRATLVRARLANANLADASIRRPSVYSDMRLDPEDLPVFRSVRMARATLTARLDGADFTEADLSEVSFVLREERDLGGPPTSGLARCNFTGAKMIGINVRGIALTRSSFRQADLSRADLRDTDLSFADFAGAVLTGARLDGAKLEGTRGLS